MKQQIIVSDKANKATENADFAAWLAETLLPADERQVATVDGVMRKVSDWNAAEIADGIGSVIGKVCIEGAEREEASVNARSIERAKMFTASPRIAWAAGLRRRSRLETVRNRENLPIAMEALREAIEIAAEILRERREEERDFLDMQDEMETWELEREDAYYESFLTLDVRTKSREEVLRVLKLRGRFHPISDSRKAKRQRKDVVFSRSLKAMRRADRSIGCETLAA